MRVLVFAREDQPLVSAVAKAVSDTAEVTKAHDKQSFKDELLNCLDGETILVFFVQTLDDLGFLEEQAKNFIDMKLVIYFERYEASLAERAYQLHPRLVTGNLDDDALLPGAVTGMLSSLVEYSKLLKS
jgi:hypothetical protein